MTTVNYRELISKKVARGCCASVRGHCLETFVLNFYSPNYKSKGFMQKELLIFCGKSISCVALLNNGMLIWGHCEKINQIQIWYLEFTKQSTVFRTFYPIKYSCEMCLEMIF